MAAADQSSRAGASKDTRPEPNVDALQAMMRLRAAKQAAAEANAAVVAAERAKEAAEAEVEAYERALGKRPRTEAEQTEAEGPTSSIDEWDYADHRREMTRMINRRAIEIGSKEHERELRTGKDGYLHHARMGLVGAVAYWALGSTALAVTMIVALIVHLKLVQQVRDALPKGERERRAQADEAIADLMEKGLAETKHCRTEQQRQEHGIGLAFIAPARDSGLIRLIGERLHVHWGTRKKREGEERGRPFAFDQAIDRRAEFNKEVALQDVPLQPLDKVQSPHPHPHPHPGPCPHWTRYSRTVTSAFFGRSLATTMTTIRRGRRVSYSSGRAASRPLRSTTACLAAEQAVSGYIYIQCVSSCGG